MIRLRVRSDFHQVRRTGQSWVHPLTVLVASDNQLAHTRIGFVASKNVGGAVQRNRAKRRLRAQLRTKSTILIPGWDLVFIARKPILDCSMSSLRAAITELLSSANLLRSEK